MITQCRPKSYPDLFGFRGSGQDVSVQTGGRVRAQCHYLEQGSYRRNVFVINGIGYNLVFKVAKFLHNRLLWQRLEDEK